MTRIFPESYPVDLVSRLRSVKRREIRTHPAPSAPLWPPAVSSQRLAGQLSECSPGPRPGVLKPIHTCHTPSLPTAPSFPSGARGLLPAIASPFQKGNQGPQRGLAITLCPFPALQLSLSWPRPRPLWPACPTSDLCQRLFPIEPSLRAQRRNRVHLEGRARSPGSARPPWTRQPRQA